MFDIIERAEPLKLSSGGIPVVGLRQSRRRALMGEDAPTSASDGPVREWCGGQSVITGFSRRLDTPLRKSRPSCKRGPMRINPLRFGPRRHEVGAAWFLSDVGRLHHSVPALVGCNQEIR